MMATQAEGGLLSSHALAEEAGKCCLGAVFQIGESWDEMGPMGISGCLCGPVTFLIALGKPHEWLLLLAGGLGQRSRGFLGPAGLEPPPKPPSTG